jgi:hypothetical protein
MAGSNCVGFGHLDSVGRYVPMPCTSELIIHLRLTPFLHQNGRRDGLMRRAVRASSCKARPPRCDRPFSDGTTQSLPASVTPSSSNTSVATISSTGLTTGLSSGSTTIAAVSGSIRVSTTLTVLNYGNRVIGSSGNRVKKRQQPGVRRWGRRVVHATSRTGLTES